MGKDVPASSNQSAWAWECEASACPESLWVYMRPWTLCLSGPRGRCAHDRSVRGEAYTHVTARDAFLNGGRAHSAWMYARATARHRVRDIARVIAFIASDDSGFMTGTYAPVNGGLAMD
jgi:hypothetical protein